VNDHELRRQSVERAYRDHADDVYRIAFAILRDPDAAVDAGGKSFPNGASVSVFDASDGSVRLIAGELGSGDLWFATPTLR
jgi:hypothetical protein